MKLFIILLGAVCTLIASLSTAPRGSGDTETPVALQQAPTSECSAFPSGGPTTNFSDLLPFKLGLGDEVVEVDALMLGMLGMLDDGTLGFAYLVAERPGGLPFVIDDIEAYAVVSDDLRDLVGAHVPSTIPGERRSLDELRFALDDDGRLYVSFWKGAYLVSGREFTVDYKNAGLPDDPTPICCKVQLGIESCTPTTCTSPGACGTPPFSCACLPHGNGLCVSPAAIELCYGHCDIPGCPGPEGSQCVHWMDGNEEKCTCRGS